MAINLLLARAVKEHRTVAELLFVGGHAEHVGSEHQRRFPLVTVKLMHGFAPILSTRDVAFVFGDDQGNAVDQQALCRRGTASHP